MSRSLARVIEDRGFMAASDAESGAPGPLSGLRVVDFYQGLSRRSGEKLVLFSERRFL
jgi:hypothetical protein